MLFWSSINFSALNQVNLPFSLRKPEVISFLNTLSSTLQRLHDETLYTMQHDGRKIYLEKVLNDYFEVSNYNPSNHEITKKVYIGNAALPADIFIFQPAENSPVFLEPTEVFIRQENEMTSAFSFTVFIPDTYSFNEPTVRALIDKYRYIGKLYNIETYTL